MNSRRIFLCLIFMLFSLLAGQLQAQSNQPDYSNQLAALRESFDKGSPEAVQQYVGDELAFAQFPTSMTSTILGQFFSGQIKLNSMEVLSVQEGEATVKFDIIGLGERTAKVLFNEDSRIKRIGLIDDIIKMQMEAQARMARQKQAPTPGELAEKYPSQKVEIPTKEGLLISGDLYEIAPGAPVILLCHQANYNKYEYSDIAPRLNEMGFNALAIDQRSGGSFAGHENATFTLASQKGLSTEMVAAEPDISTAVDYLAKRYGRPIILWGSSYASSLSLFVGATHDQVKAIIAFSPGDYFGAAKPSLSTVFADLDKPFWVTSSKQEAAQLSKLIGEKELNDYQSQFVPTGDGFHGSRALWVGQDGGEAYWQEVRKFLLRVKDL